MWKNNILCKNKSWLFRRKRIANGLHLVNDCCAVLFWRLEPGVTDLRILPKTTFDALNASPLSSLAFRFAQVPVVCKVMMQQNTCILIYHNRSHERQRRSMLASVMSKWIWPRLSAYAFALRATPFGSDIRKWIFVHHSLYGCLSSFV